MTMLRIAQAQIPVLTDREKLASALEHTAEKAAGESADFLTLPEMFCCPYDINCFSDYAEEQGGPIWQICSRIARSYHIFLSAGTMPERDENGRIYNRPMYLTAMADRLQNTVKCISSISV